MWEQDKGKRGSLCARRFTGVVGSSEYASRHFWSLSFGPLRIPLLCSVVSLSWPVRLTSLNSELWSCLQLRSHKTCWHERNFSCWWCQRHLRKRWVLKERWLNITLSTSVLEQHTESGRNMELVRWIYLCKLQIYITLIQILICVMFICSSKRVTIKPENLNLTPSLDGFQIYKGRRQVMISDISSCAQI